MSLKRFIGRPHALKLLEPQSTLSYLSTVEGQWEWEEDFHLNYCVCLDVIEAVNQHWMLLLPSHPQL